MSRRPSTAAALVALIATLTSACTGGGQPPPASNPVPVKIAFLHDMSVPSSTQIVAPALLGLELALQEALERGDLPVIPEVVGLDVEGDDAKASELAQEVADDPSYVAAVIGPFWSEPASVGDLLQAAGIPTLSLSELDPALAAEGWSSWRRVVAGVARVGGVGGGDPWIVSVGQRHMRGGGRVEPFRDPRRSADDEPRHRWGSRPRRSFRMKTPSSVLERVDRAGCGAVAWTGFDPGATLLRTGLMETGAGSLPLVGSSAMKTESFLSVDGRGGRRNDRHVRVRRPGVVHAAGGSPLHPRLPVPVRLGSRCLRLRGLGCRRHAARRVPLGRDGPSHGDGGPGGIERL